MDDKEVSKICGVCGDRASGHNFNAITCESCKAFFRRNALKNIEFKCRFNGKCKLDSLTRKFCKKCRLKKCFDIGMNKEWILSDEQKLNLKRKIEENRIKRQIIVDQNNFYNFSDVSQIIENSYSINNTYTPNDNNYMSPDFDMNTNLMNANDLQISRQEPKGFTECEQNCSNFTEFNYSMNSNTTDVVYNAYNNRDYNPIATASLIRGCSDCNECKQFCRQRCRQCSSSQTYSPNGDITSDSGHSSAENFSDKYSDISIDESNNSSIPSNISENSINRDEIKIKNNVNEVHIPESVYNKAIELEFAAIPFKESINDSNNYEFNKFERERMNNLVMAAADIDHKPLNHEKLRFVGKEFCAEDGPDLWESGIRVLVRMSKKIDPFRSLCLNDQIALMKGGFLEVLVMRSVVYYNSEHEYWAIVKHRDDTDASMVKLDIFKGKNINVYEAYRKFMNGWQIEWENDSNLLFLLTVIILFNPDRQNLNHKEIVKLEQQIYMYLLQRYLLSKYKSKCEAKLKFLKLMTKLEELHILSNEHIKLYLETDPKNISPLVIEILDLNRYHTL